MSILRTLWACMIAVAFIVAFVLGTALFVIVVMLFNRLILDPIALSIGCCPI